MDVQINYYVVTYQGDHNMYSMITLVNTIFLARGLQSDSNCILAADSKSVISFCLSHQVFKQ